MFSSMVPSHKIATGLLSTAFISLGVGYARDNPTFAVIFTLLFSLAGSACAFKGLKEQATANENQNGLLNSHLKL